MRLTREICEVINAKLKVLYEKKQDIKLDDFPAELKENFMVFLKGKTLYRIDTTIMVHYIDFAYYYEGTTIT